MDSRELVTIVSGLPRSGTSMVMRMLAAGGHPLLVDGQRAADADNPQGYFEYEPVRRLNREAGWLEEARGKAVKIVSPLLKYVPRELSCRVILIERDMGEVLASQAAMLRRQGKKAGDEAEVRRAYERLHARLDEWLRETAWPVLKVQHGEALREPVAAAEAIAAFLEQELDIAAMAAAVDPSLYRQKRATG